MGSSKIAWDKKTKILGLAMPNLYLVIIERMFSGEAENVEDWKAGDKSRDIEEDKALGIREKKLV